MLTFQAYFITNMEPIRFWEFTSLILAGLGYERYTLSRFMSKDDLEYRIR